MDWWLLTFFLGAILSLFLPIVPVLFQLFLLLLLAITFFYHKKLRTSSGLLFGAFWLLFNAFTYQQKIPIELTNAMQEKQTLMIQGQVLTLTKFTKEVELTKQQYPQQHPQQNIKFNFKVHKVNDQVLAQDLIVRLNWRKVSVNIGQGQLLKLNVKLKPIHGLANLGSFNYQAWLKSKNIVATGYVVNNRKNSQNNTSITESISLRQELFNQYQTLFLQSEESKHSLMPLMFALAFGERSQLTLEHWRILQATGTGHLIAISGLHLGLVASGGYFVVMILVRLLPLILFSRKKLSLRKLTRLNHFLLNSNSRYLAIFFSVAITVFYAFLAGFSLPTQRALVMLIIYWLTRLLAINLSIKRWFLLTIFILVVMSPFSLFTASFWLSVYAVSFIFFTLWRFRFYLQQGNSMIRFIKGLLMIQVSLTLMILPISALFFQQLSVVAFLANILAVPWMSFISIPCALLSVVIMPVNEFVAQFFIYISLESITLLWHYLAFLSEISFAQQMISQWQQQCIVMVTALVFISVFVAPSISRRMPVKYLLSQLNRQLKKRRVSYFPLGIFFVISLFAVSSQFNESKNTAQQSDVWQLHLFEVGQGLSVLISRDKQAILYDTGAAYPSGFNMADSVILPYLRYAGIKQLDKVFLSHSDNDHAGGLTQLLSGIDVKQIITNDNQVVNRYQQVRSCYQGMNFHWQNLTIKVLWPLMPEGNVQFSDQSNNQLNNQSQTNKVKTKSTKQGNDDSCVLLISDGKHKVLLTGDISKKVEHQLLSIYPKLTADVLLVPHHGSKTSSSTAFIEQLSPKIALVSAGFMNRWHMPVKQVVTRYRQQNIQLINSSDKGQVILTFDNHITLENYHDDLRPFWFSQ